LSYALHFYEKMPMFHVEHMKNSFFTLIFLIFAVSACRKVDPEAYKTDPILLDYQSQLAETTTRYEAAIKAIETTHKEVKKSVPQTGDTQKLQNKLNAKQAEADKLAQQIQFWKIHIESRAKEAQDEYLRAFKDNKPWPDKQKIESYRAEKRLRQAKMEWDQKERIEEYKKSTQPKPVGGAEGSQSEGGGGHE
jgi:hypothetical protein